MSADLHVRYPREGAATRVRIARGSLRRLGAWVRTLLGRPRVLVVTDPRVAALYGAMASRSLAAAGCRPEMVVVPAGERAKSARTLARLWEELAALQLRRADAVVALGGGVVGDLAGFAAATYARGIAWVGVPTTVVAQTDSALGGKTGIDLAAGKNLAGAFHHPAGVLVDPDVLATLPERELRAGTAEIIKMGVVVDAGLLDQVERLGPDLRSRRLVAWEHVVRGALAAKARIVAADPLEREGGPRASLNFGHTLGHALEAALGYRRLRHGEAVAIGMRFAARLSERLDGFDAASRIRIDTILDAWRLPKRIPRVSLAAIERHLSRDKKRGAGVRWILTPRIGRASVPRLIPHRIVRAALVEHGASVE